jgi:hypothetical protein
MPVIETPSAVNIIMESPIWGLLGLTVDTSKAGGLADAAAAGVAAAAGLAPACASRLCAAIITHPAAKSHDAPLFQYRQT